MPLQIVEPIIREWRDYRRLSTIYARISEALARIEPSLPMLEDSAEIWTSPLMKWVDLKKIVGDGGGGAFIVRHDNYGRACRSIVRYRFLLSICRFACLARASRQCNHGL